MMALPAQKEWIPPPRTDFLFSLLKKDTKKGNVQGKVGQWNEEVYQKEEAVSKQEDPKKLFQQITCKIKIRWARLRLLTIEFAKYG